MKDFFLSDYMDYDICELSLQPILSLQSCVLPGLNVLVLALAVCDVLTLRLM